MKQRVLTLWVMTVLTAVLATATPVFAVSTVKWSSICVRMPGDTGG